MNASVIRDVFVLIGGYASKDYGQRTGPLMPNASTGTGDLFRRIQSDEVLVPAGHQKKVLGLQGTLIDTDVDGGFDFIQANFHPLGKLIIYGHSMGGAAALELCRRIDAELPFYSLYSGLTTDSVSVERTPKAWESDFFLPGPVVGGANKLNMPARVDLLVTVDAARGPTSAWLDRSIATCVRSNLNYYQTVPYGYEKSFGGPSTAKDPRKTIVWNHDLTGRRIPDADSAMPPHVPTHVTIDDQTNNTVMFAIKEAVKKKQVTAFWDVVA